MTKTRKTKPFILLQQTYTDVKLLKLLAHMSSRNQWVSQLRHLWKFRLKVEEKVRAIVTRRRKKLMLLL